MINLTWICFCSVAFCTEIASLWISGGWSCAPCCASWLSTQWRPTPRMLSWPMSVRWRLRVIRSKHTATGPCAPPPPNRTAGPEHQSVTVTSNLPWKQRSGSPSLSPLSGCAQQTDFVFYLFVFWPGWVWDFVCPFLYILNDSCMEFIGKGGP